MSSSSVELSPAKSPPDYRRSQCRWDPFVRSFFSGARTENSCDLALGLAAMSGHTLFPVDTAPQGRFQYFCHPVLERRRLSRHEKNRRPEDFYRLGTMIWMF